MGQLQILWTAVGRVLIGEIIRSGRVQAPSSSQSVSSFAPSSSASSVNPLYASSASSSGQLQTQLYMQPGTGSAPTASAGAGMPQRDAVRAVLDRVLGAMNRFRDTSPLMGTIHDGLVSLLGAL